MLQLASMIVAAAIMPIAAAAADRPAYGGRSAPLATTVEALATDPGRYDRQRVHLLAQIDRCQGWTCNACPMDATNTSLPSKACLPIEWDHQAGPAPARGFNFDLVYRYADVEMVAWFDASCRLPGYVCTDRGTVLVNARAVRVLRRRPSALGLGIGLPRNRLIAAPPVVEAELVSLVRSAATGSSDTGNYRAFIPADQRDGHWAWLCRSYGTDDLAKWPVDAAAAAAPSTEDRFRCFQADRTSGRWFIHPD